MTLDQEPSRIPSSILLTYTRNQLKHGMFMVRSCKPPLRRTRITILQPVAFRLRRIWATLKLGRETRQTRIAYYTYLKVRSVGHPAPAHPRWVQSARITSRMSPTAAWIDLDHQVISTPKEHLSQQPCQQGTKATATTYLSTTRMLDLRE